MIERADIVLRSPKMVHNRVAHVAYFGDEVRVQLEGAAVVVDAVDAFVQRAPLRTSSKEMRFVTPPG